jgi:hypothetical protein
MARVLLIGVAAGCAVAGAGCANHSPSGPLAPLAATEPTQPDVLWDRGSFVDVTPGASAEEHFEIFQTAAGYRFEVRWTRPAQTGEPGDGTVTLATDAHFGPVTGDMVSTLRRPGSDEVTRSSIRRDPDGRLATEVIASDGSKETARSRRRNDWFIGGSITAFLVALCQADAAVTSPLVYPDKDTTLEPPLALRVEAIDGGAEREVMVRRLTYLRSKNVVVVACEGGKLAGEITRGMTIVRAGDLALARALETSFRQ